MGPEGMGGGGGDGGLGGSENHFSTSSRDAWEHFKFKWEPRFCCTRFANCSGSSSSRHSSGGRNL